MYHLGAGNIAEGVLLENSGSTDWKYLSKQMTASLLCNYRSHMKLTCTNTYIPVCHSLQTTDCCNLLSEQM